MLKKNLKKKENYYRAFYYIFGLLMLALGLTLNIKSQLGVSTILSLPYVISQILHYNLGNITFITYIFMVIAQFIIKGTNKTMLDLLQIPLGIIFTRFLNLFNTNLIFPNQSIQFHFLILMCGILCTGIGAAMTVNMNLIAVPPDAIVNTIARKANKSMGFTKNIFDIFCVICAVILSLLLSGEIMGIGIGTLVAMIGVGRVIAIFNRLWKPSMILKAGLVT